MEAFIGALVLLAIAGIVGILGDGLGLNPADMKKNIEDSPSIISLDIRNVMYENENPDGTMN